MVIGIYHPPYCGCILITNNRFIDDLIEWLTESLANDKSMIIMRDFNIHINKRGEDEDATAFMNSIESLGFQQHVNFSSHRMGNTLDLVLTEYLEPFKMETILPGNYISGHCAVNCTISLEKTILKKQTIRFRKIIKIDMTKLVEEMNLDSITTNNLDEFVGQLETNMQSALDKNAWEMTKNIVSRKKVSWFTDEIRAQKEP